MNRVIKFRAWDKISNKMIVHEQDFIPLKVTSIGVLKLNPLTEYESFIIIDPYRFILMQFTGLLDKNGKEIFEGDILRIATQSGRIEHFEVKWGVHRRDMKSGWTVDIPGFSFVNDEGFPTFPIVNNYLNGHDLDIIEVIGNIHEHPHLLTNPK